VTGWIFALAAVIAPESGAAAVAPRTQIVISASVEIVRFESASSSEQTEQDRRPLARQTTARPSGRQVDFY